LRGALGGVSLALLAQNAARPEPAEGLSLVATRKDGALAGPVPTVEA